MVKCSFNNMLLFSFCILSSSFLYAMDNGKPVMRGALFGLTKNDLVPTANIRIQEVFNPTLKAPTLTSHSQNTAPFHKTIINNPNPKNGFTQEFINSADAAYYNDTINHKTKHIMITMENGKVFTGQGVT